jgi:hypothetical protein
MVITLLLHIALTVHAARAGSPGLIDAAVAEAAGIWAPYGIAVDTAAADDCDWCHACGSTDGDLDVLTVVPIETRRSAVAPGWHGALGVISFGPDGIPAPVITVFLTDIERFIAVAHLVGMPQELWSSTMRQEILGRVLGRVIAHEIGHYLLRSPLHAANGLMRPMQFASDLVAPSRHRFMLTPSDAARLEDRR